MITEKELKQGKKFEFISENGDMATISYGETWGSRKMFKIWLNCKTVHMSYGFISMIRKLEQLKKDFNLSLYQYNEI